MKNHKLSKILCAVLLSSTCVLNATSLQEAVDNTLVKNPELKAIFQNNKAYGKYIDEARADYKPKIDLSLTGEKKRTYSKLNDDPTLHADQAGYNAQLKIEQLLYNGGLTPARVDEARFRDQVNRLLNDAKVEGVILDGVNSYLDLVKYDQRLKLSKINLQTHEEYLKIAKSTEEISGDILDTYEVQAKLHLAKKNYLDEIDNEQIANNSFKRITGSEVEEGVDMPVVDETILPVEIEELVKLALTNNNTVLAQVAKIKEQRAIIRQEDSKFFPVIKFYLSATADDDLLTINTRKNIYSARVVMDYNFYSGGRDQASSQKENIFLQESQKVLKSKSDLVVDEINSAFASYKNTKDKITELQGYVNTNEEIVKIYKGQFEAGARTFVDVLDIESDLYNAKVQLIDEETKLVGIYYTMLSLTSNLQKTIATQSE